MAWVSILAALIIAGLAQTPILLAAVGGSEPVWLLSGEEPPDSSWDWLVVLLIIAVSIVLFIATTHIFVGGWWRSRGRPASTSRTGRIVPSGLMRALNEIEESRHGSAGGAEPSGREDVATSRVPDWFSRIVKGMGLTVEEVLAAVRVVRENGTELTAYLASVILSERFSFANETEREAFIINMSTVLEDFLRMSQHQHGVGQAVETPLYEEIFLDELVERGPEPGVAYLLDEEVVSAPGLPSAIPASLPWRNCKVYNMETTRCEEIRLELGLLDRVPLLILTRAVRPSRIRRVGVERNHKGSSSSARPRGYPIKQHF
jgi:hypothetical protein